MKKTTIDTTLLPKAWLRWTTKKGNFWLDCSTGKRQDTPPNIEFSWRNKTNVCYNSGSRPMHAYMKYHSDIKLLEIAAVTFETTRKDEVKEWKYAGDKYFINIDKVVYDENGKECTSDFNLYQYHTGRTFKLFLSMFARLSYTEAIIDEFRKFIGGSTYTIGNGRVVEVDYIYKVQDWYIKKQRKSTTGKTQKLVDTLTETSLCDTSEIIVAHPIPKERYGIMYFERVDDSWSVLRMFKRISGDVIKEIERMYLHDNGENRIASPTPNGWIPARHSGYYYYSYAFVNKQEAMEKCKRLKYIAPLFDETDSYIKSYLTTALRFPEIEQFMKLGYTEFAKRIAKSHHPKADLKHAFGDQYDEKETTVLRKTGLTKHQLDKHIATYVRDYGGWSAMEILRKMRDLFGEGLVHLDDTSFDKYYDALYVIRHNAHNFHRYTRDLDLDEKKFIKNAIRLAEKHENTYSVLNDTMSMYIYLTIDTKPEIDWYFDSYSDLSRAHDIIYGLKREQDAARRARWDMEAAERAKKDEEKRIKLDKERKQYEYEDDDYIIRLPLNGNEIATEGMKQRICIGGYVSNHSNGYTNLFFLRKKSEPDIPFYAIELNNSHNVVQIHGYGNKWLGCNPEAIPTVIRWLRKNGFKCSDQILTCKSTGYSSTRSYVEMPTVD